MTHFMKAAVARRLGEPLVIEDLTIPSPGPGEIQIQLAACGVCHTDLHAVQGDWPVKPVVPFIPGHEGVGHVSAVGVGVTRVKEGDRVGAPWLHSACGHCRYCLGGRETLCHDQQNTGYSVNGGFAEYLIADPAYVGHVPTSLDFLHAAPILCAGVTVYKGLKATEARPGDCVVISGVGGLGHLAIQYARAMGLTVVAVDVDDRKLALALELGAASAINAATCPDPAAEVRRLTAGGAQAVLVTAVSTPAFRQALGMTARGGTVALVGLPPGDFPLPIFDVVLGGVTVRGSIVGTRLDLEEALDFAAAGKVRATITSARLEDVNAVFDQMRAGGIEGRVVLDMAL